MSVISQWTPFGGQRAADVQHKQPTDPLRVSGWSRVRAVIVMTRSAAATTVKAVTCPKEDKWPRRSCRDNRTQPMFEYRHLVYPALAQLFTTGDARVGLRSHRRLFDTSSHIFLADFAKSVQKRQEVTVLLKINVTRVQRKRAKLVFFATQVTLLVFTDFAVDGRTF